MNDLETDWAHPDTTTIVDSLSRHEVGRGLRERGSVLANDSCGAPPLPDLSSTSRRRGGLVVASGCAQTDFSE
jgi:hypothetical protein